MVSNKINEAAIHATVQHSYKFSRIKTTVPLTLRVSLSFSQKSCGPSGVRADRPFLAIGVKDHERSAGAKEFETEPSGVGRGNPARLPRTDKCPPYGATGRGTWQAAQVPLLGPRPHLLREGTLTA